MKECPICKTCYEDTETKCKIDSTDLVLGLPGPTKFGHYTIQTKLKNTINTVTYTTKNLDETISRTFTLKVLTDCNTKLAENFVSNIALYQSLHHPNIVQLIDAGYTEHNDLYLITESTEEGRPLQKIITSEGPLTPERTLKIAKQICDGLSAAHSFDVIHQNLTPDNVIVSSSSLNTAELEDLGFVLKNNTDKTDTNHNNNSIIKISNFGFSELIKPTNINSLPYYSSPEQCANEALDQRSDIYSLGIILFQMLTKELPFKGNSESITSGHITKPPPSLRSFNSGISEALEEVVLCTISKNPNERPQTVEELYANLELAITHNKKLATSKTGTLLIQTDPISCDVYVDGEPRGKTSTTGKLALQLSYGQHQLRFSCTGWHEKVITITIGDSDQNLGINLIRRGTIEGQSIADIIPSTSISGTLPENLPLVKNKQTEFPIDLLLGSLCVLLAIVACFGLFPSPDPFSLSMAKHYSLLPVLAQFGCILGTAGIAVSLILADYKYSYQPIPSLYWIFNISRVLFIALIGITVIFTPIGAILSKWELPSIPWFMMKFSLILTLSILYNRIRSRHRVSFI